MKALRIPGDVVDAIVAHAEAERPNECCGLLVGSTEAIERCVPARNLAASPTRYLVDPADHFAAIRSARAAGMRVIGAYHSHPDAPPVPSKRDLAEAAFSDFVYVIVSLQSDDVRDRLRAYHLSDDGATPVELVRVGGGSSFGRAGVAV